jgi:hypothetical protein
VCGGSALGTAHQHRVRYIGHHTATRSIYLYRVADNRPAHR